MSLTFTLMETCIVAFANYGKTLHMKTMSAKNQQLNSFKKSKGLLCAGAFCITIAILLIFYCLKGYAPFGDQSLASHDANIQYLDLFAYLKDVIAGDSSILYTLSKGLGGTGIAVFSYYLSSPFNLLIIFFDKNNLVTFIDIIIMLKLGTAALTMAYFLQSRFSEKLRPCFVVLLSLSYALMQYSIAQCCNVMWLDGVYMLPLMLLGVSKIVNEEKPWLLFFSSGLAILFNWYSAGINCLYTIIWFVLEWLLIVPEHGGITKDFIKITAKSIGRYILAMAGGVMLSACLFLPTVISLSLGGRGAIDWSIFANNFSGNIANIIQNFTIGSTSSNGSVSLYCGTLALIGCIGFFCSSKSIQRKIKIGIILIGSVMIFYWQPLVAVFSLLKNVGSYWYRYSYVTIFLIIFIAADYFAGIEQEAKSPQTIIKIGLLFSVALLTLSWVKSVWPDRYVYYTCVFTVGISIFIAIYIKNIITSGFAERIAALTLSCIVAFELMGNAHLILKNESKQNVTEYNDYSIDQQTQIAQIQDMDPSLYRISQTATYNMTSDLLSANYNEALAYDYWSIATYTSDPDDSQREFLDSLGYRINGDNMCIVNTSIIAADSLLGVKYVLSPYDIAGLEKVDELGQHNEKNVYYNPYCLPLAFTYTGNRTDETQDTDDMNPFEYQNFLYSQLLGENVELFLPVSYEKTDKKNTRTYTIKVPEGNYALYGNITWDSYMNATLDVNHAYETGYSKWLSPSVFYIPNYANTNNISVTLMYENKTMTDEQFYALDIDKLEQVSQLLQSKEADQISIKQTSAEVEVSGREGDNLLISIPSHTGWEITLNGQDIEPEEFGNCLISVPLEDGTNKVEMHFTVPGLNVGIGITIFTIALAVLIFVIKKIREKKRE